MIRQLFWFIGAIVALLLIFFLHIAVANFFLFPINYINVIFLSLVWLITYRGAAFSLWLALILSFLLEIFSAAHFGLNMIAMTISLYFVAYFLTNIFINHSWFIVFLSGFLGVLCYRFIFGMLLYLLKFFSRGSFTSIYKMSVNALLEAGLTAATLAILYFISSLVIKKLNPKYISVIRNV